MRRGRGSGRGRERVRKWGQWTAGLKIFTRVLLCWAPAEFTPCLVAVEPVQCLPGGLGNTELGI